MTAAASVDASVSVGAWPADWSEGLAGRDAFLRLLVTQLQMQDPLEPLRGEEFAAQLAQFSTVEQLQQANLALSLLQHAEATTQALLLIGRRVETGDGITGQVEAVVFDGGRPALLVGDQRVDLGDVTRVY